MRAQNKNEDEWVIHLGGKKIPMRQCVGCRESREKKDLIRIIKSGEGDDAVVSVDRTGRANGRGAYLCDKLECLWRAKKNHALNRAFKINVADEIYDDLERQLGK